MSEQMKAVVFEGITYRVPVWVNWMARDYCGEVWGYDIEPFITRNSYAADGTGRARLVLPRSHDESWRNSAARV